MNTRDETTTARATIPILAALFCGLFGVALIVNTQLAADGVWYWYAQEYLSGSRLYADLGLALQPLYALLTAFTIRLFGGSWLATRIPALLGVVLLTLPIYLLARRSGRTGWQQGVLIVFTFFVGIHFEAFRFDDYHVIVDGCSLIAAVLLVDLRRSSDETRHVVLAILLGLVCGLSLVTRLTDGGVLAGSSIGLVFVLSPGRRITLCSLVLASLLVTALGVVLLTGDTVPDWFHFSIAGAASPKGGASHLLVSPVWLPWNAAKSLVRTDGPILSLVLLLATWPALLWSTTGHLRSWRRMVAIAGLALLTMLECWLLVTFRKHDLIVVASGACVWVAYAMLLALALRTGRALLRWDLARLQGDERFLMLIPILLWMSGSLSSGGFHYGLYFPFAFFVLLLAVSHPTFVSSAPAKALVYSLLTVLAVAGADFRYRNPCSWHSYRSYPLFQKRQIVKHPLYGPMVIDSTLESFITQVCSDIEAKGGGELLSLPFPFGNYYCGIHPWNGYVQTFFDTSNERLIRGLMQELEQRPPAWILYQRQPANLARHEAAFNSGKPLPHRALDKLLMAKLAHHQWSLVRTSNFMPESTWMLIYTR